MNSRWRKQDHGIIANHPLCICGKVEKQTQYFFKKGGNQGNNYRQFMSPKKYIIQNKNLQSM